MFGTSGHLLEVRIVLESGGVWKVWANLINKDIFQK